MSKDGGLVDGVDIASDRKQSLVKDSRYHLFNATVLGHRQIFLDIEVLQGLVLDNGRKVLEWPGRGF